MMISVCIATYNGSKYIRKQIGSIISQLESHDEIIISDDSSTDDTIDILKSFNDKRIKIYENQKFKNAIFNFENSLNLAKGDIIFLSDQDDLWHPEKVKVMVASLQSYDTVVCDHSVIDESDNVVEPSYFAKVKSGPGIFLNLRKNTYYGCCLAFKREILSLVLPFPKKIPMHDIWIGFVTDLCFTSKFVDFPYTKYRKHDSNVSNATEFISTKPFYQKLLNRVNILIYTPLIFYRKFKKQ